MGLSRLAKRFGVLAATITAVVVIVYAIKSYAAYRAYSASAQAPEGSDSRRGHLDCAIRLSRSNALYHRAAAREGLRAFEMDRKRNAHLLEKAEHHLFSALRAEPTNAAGYYELGNYYLLKEKLDEAQQAYDQALKLAPCNANLYESVGRQNLKRGGNQRWVAELRRAIELDPTRLSSVFDAIWTLTRSTYELRKFAGNDWQLRAAAVRFLRDRKEHSAALRECVSLCREATDAPEDAKQQLTTLLNHMRQHLIAVVFLRRWLEKSPDSYTLRRALAVSLRSGGRTEEAFDIAKVLVKEEPTDHATRMLLGDLHQRKGDFEAAETEFQKGIDLRPQSVHYHLRLIDFYIRTKQGKKALKAAEHAVHVFPEQALVYHALGSVQLARGNEKDALRAYRKAVHLDPDNPRYKRAVEEVKGKRDGDSDR